MSGIRGPLPTLTGPAPVIPDRTVRRRLGREDVVRYGLVALFGLVLYLFVLYPMAHLAWRSLLNNDGAFVGLANYARYFGTPAIAASITNSLYVRDPEGNTIEIYADVPLEEYDWTKKGMGFINRPFDIEAVPAPATT